MSFNFLEIACELDDAGLLWQPEIGDEITDRDKLGKVSILVDPHGMTPKELRSIFIWLPTVDQLVNQLEARQAILFHVGLELTETRYCYKTVLQSPLGPIESEGDSLRLSVGKALRELMVGDVERLQ